MGTRGVEISHADGRLEIKDPSLDVLLEQRVDPANEVHEHDVEDGEHLERIPHHLAVEVGIIVEHIMRINVQRLPALQFNNAVHHPHVLALLHDDVRPAGLLRVPEVAEEAEDGGVDVLHADVGSPHEHRGGVGVHGVDVVVTGVGGGGQVFIGGHGGGGGLPAAARAGRGGETRGRGSGGRGGSRRGRGCLVAAEGGGGGEGAGGGGSAAPPCRSPASSAHRSGWG